MPVEKFQENFKLFFEDATNTDFEKIKPDYKLKLTNKIT